MPISREAMGWIDPPVETATGEPPLSYVVGVDMAAGLDRSAEVKFRIVPIELDAAKMVGRGVGVDDLHAIAEAAGMRLVIQLAPSFPRERSVLSFDPQAPLDLDEIKIPKGHADPVAAGIYGIDPSTGLGIRIPSPKADS